MKRKFVLREILKILKSWENSRMETKTAQEILLYLTSVVALSLIAFQAGRSVGYQEAYALTENICRALK
jgi:hypothetical protein